MTRAAPSAREWLGQQVPLSRDMASETGPRLGARVCLLKQPNGASQLFVGALCCSPGSVWCRGSAAGWPASTLGRGVIPQLCMPLPGCRRVPWSPWVLLGLLGVPRACQTFSCLRRAGKKLVNSKLFMRALSKMAS